MIFLLKWVMFKKKAVNFQGCKQRTYPQAADIYANTLSFHFPDREDLVLHHYQDLSHSQKQRKDSSRPISTLHKEKFHRIRCYSITIKTQELPSFSPRQTLMKSKAPTKSNLQTIFSHILKHKKSSTQAPKPRKTPTQNSCTIFFWKFPQNYQQHHLASTLIPLQHVVPFIESYTTHSRS